jgi:hypothetical protein
MKKKFQKEYETYMKKVTDAFVDMQSDKINVTIGQDIVFYEVMWEGGLHYEFDLNCSRYIKGVTFEEMKEWNSTVAKRYLKENTLSYDEWLYNEWETIGGINELSEAIISINNDISLYGAR